LDLLGLAWVANPLFGLGLVLLVAGRRGAALACGLGAVAAGLGAVHLDVRGPWRLREGYSLGVGGMGRLAAGSGLTPGALTGGPGVAKLQPIRSF
jgi:hypothetical protein